MLTTNGETPISGFSKFKRQLDARCQIAPWKLQQDLRRSASTYMNESGADPWIVETILNHKLAGVAAVYNHAKYMAQKRAALEAWAAVVTGA